jgi:energy-coupling factor transporter ATP-binding protein EcfA2
MLKRARVRGYKCLEDVTVTLEPLTVLIGRNDSGKSSFLQAIAAASGAMPEFFGTDGTVRVESENHALLSDFGAPLLSVGPRNASDENLRPTGWDDPRRAEVKTTAPLSLDPARIASKASVANASLDGFVAHRGGGTAAYLATLALGDRRRFDAIEAGLHEVTKGRVRSVVVRDSGSSTYELSFLLFDGTIIPASDLSQGLLLYVAFLSLVHRDPMPAALLIEEPETGLHPMRLFEVVDMLRALSKRGVQVILTTHSPDLLSACSPREVRIFQRPTPEAPTQVHELPADFERRAMREPLGQVWASRGEEGLLDLVTEPIAPAIQADPK